VRVFTAQEDAINIFRLLNITQNINAAPRQRRLSENLLMPAGDGSVGELAVKVHCTKTGHIPA
jgi:hypothetical protein